MTYITCPDAILPSPCDLQVLQSYNVSMTCKHRACVYVHPASFVQVADVYRKIRLTVRFLLGNVHDFDPSQHAVPHSELPLTDRYLLSRFAILLKEAQTSYSQYNYSRVYQVRP